MNPVPGIDDRRALLLRQKDPLGVFHGNRLAIHSNLERTERARLQSGFQVGEFHRGKSKPGGSEGKPRAVRGIAKTRKNGGCGTRRKSLGFVQKLVPDLRRISNKMPLTLTLSRPTGEGTARPVSRSFHSGWIRPPTEHDSPSPIRYVYNEAPPQTDQRPCKIRACVWLGRPLKNSAHLSISLFVQMVSVFDECLPLPARHERGEGRGGGSPNPTRRCRLLSPALSSLRGREGDENCGTPNRYPIRWERAGVRVGVPQKPKLFLHESLVSKTTTDGQGWTRMQKQEPLFPSLASVRKTSVPPRGGFSQKTTKPTEPSTPIQSPQKIAKRTKRRVPIPNPSFYYLTRLPTLTLSRGEREQRALRSGKPTGVDCSPGRAGFTLSPRERAGVRGNGAKYVQRIGPIPEIVDLGESSGRAGGFLK